MLTISVRPRTPTTARLRRANGVFAPTVGAHRLGEARDLVVEDVERRLRRHVARRQARAAGRDDERVAAAAPRQRAPRSRRVVGDDRALDREPELGQARRERVARRVLAGRRRRCGRSR